MFFHIFITTKAPQVTNLGQMDVFPIFATSYHQGHQGTILDLGNNGNPCKTSNFYPKIWKTFIFGISWGMPKTMKNLGKTDVFPYICYCWTQKIWKARISNICHWLNIEVWMCEMDIFFSQKYGCWKIDVFSMFPPCFLVPVLNEILILSRDAVSSVSGNWHVLSGGYRLPLWFWWLSSLTATQLQFDLCCSL
jgi:hypothetical protein